MSAAALVLAQAQERSNEFVLFDEFPASVVWVLVIQFLLFAGLLVLVSGVRSELKRLKESANTL